MKEWIKNEPEFLASGNVESLLQKLPSRRLFEVRTKLHEILNLFAIQPS